MGFTNVGLKALSQVAKETRTNFDSSGSRLNYFTWKPGEKKVLRFISEDDYLKGDFYEFIQDNKGTTHSFLVDPDDPDRLLRYKSASPGVGWQMHFKKGLIAPKPRNKGVAIAVLRHEVRNEAGKCVVEDLISEIEVEGETFPARTFGLVIQPGSFWSSLDNCRERYGSLVDRDYEISRQGEKLDTRYNVLPLPEDPDMMDSEFVKSFYFYGVKTDESDPDRFLKCSTTVLDWAESYSSEDRHKFFLAPDGGETQQEQGDEAQTQTGPVQSPTATAFAAFKSSNAFSSLQDTLRAKAQQQ